jgi:hypothetical protein
MTVKSRLRTALGALATLPFNRRLPAISPPKQVSHGRWAGYLSAEFNRPGMRVLEVGSRVVTGANCRSLFARAEYVGFDFYPGPNVDVVGDAHRLTTYFPEGTKFDLIFSSAVFEHLHMPWLVAEEIQKLLPIGGMAFVETHFSYSAHERPWNFFQYSDMGLRALFNRSLGFELVDCGMSNPIGGYFTKASEPYLRYGAIRELYCHSEILVRKIDAAEGFDWRRVEMDSIVDGTRYPPPKS